ncbi:MAG: hypothetical protein HRU20_20895 [Pseudomonadales bacterium]|nr:hypothetical protein [Pseudomonadales bacterium]
MEEWFSSVCRVGGKCFFMCELACALWVCLPVWQAVAASFVQKGRVAKTMLEENQGALDRLLDVIAQQL